MFSFPSWEEEYRLLGETLPQMRHNSQFDVGLRLGASVAVVNQCRRTCPNMFYTSSTAYQLYVNMYSLLYAPNEICPDKSHSYDATKGTTNCPECNNTHFHCWSRLVDGLL